MAMRPMRLYLAGPLFTIGERQQNNIIAWHLRVHGYECFVPQETEENLRREPSAKAIFDSDVKGVDWCDVVVACIDGPDPDSGTAWELGYAFAKGKSSVLYRTDFRTACGDFDGQPVNLMLTCSAQGVVAFQGPVLIETLVRELCATLERLRL